MLLISGRREGGREENQRCVDAVDQWDEKWSREGKKRRGERWLDMGGASMWLLRFSLQNATD